MVLPKKKKIYFDFEYTQSNEAMLRLFCVSLRVENSPNVKSYWLLGSDEKTKELADWFQRVKDKFVFVSYGINAEARAMLSMGLYPHDYQYIDLYTMWRQLTYNNNECEYGTYFLPGTNIKRKSIAPSFDPRRNMGKDNREMGYSLVDCVAHELEINLDAVYKESVRNLILENKDTYTAQEQQQIIEYCESDIKYLQPLHEKMRDRLVRYLTFYLSGDMEQRREQIDSIFIGHGQFCAATAIMESTGIPLDMKSLRNLMRNHKLAKNHLIEELNKLYPFFKCVRKRKTRLQTDYIDSYEAFASFIENHPAIDHTQWEKTEKSDKYKRTDDYLEQYDGIPELKAYRKTCESIGQLKWLKEPDNLTESILDSIGSDHRLRTFFGVFGTQTGRNAPAAKRFIFAMSAWLRCLIRAPKGRAVTEVDFASQEFYVAAVLSGDEVMLAAYASGDPYVFFAKRVGLMPQDGTKQSHPEVRELVKGLILGTQYGLGVRRLAVQLSANMGRIVSVEETQKLLDYHKKTFRKYWAWLTKIESQYNVKKALVLDDYWALLKDNPNSLSIKNWPTQGTGGSILRKCVVEAQKQGIMCIASLHDAIYIEHDADSTADVEKLKAIMVQITVETLKTRVPIRVEEEIHPWDKVWVSKKGKKYYEMLKEYLEPQETGKDVLARLEKTALANFSC